MNIRYYASKKSRIQNTPLHFIVFKHSLYLQDVLLHPCVFSLDTSGHDARLSSSKTLSKAQVSIVRRHRGYDGPPLT